MKITQKRGLSPVIATVLLISMTLVLALIIFIWAKSFIGEQATKFGEPVENSCDEIRFNAEYYSDIGEINVVNKGNIALWGLSIKEKSFGSLTEVKQFEGNTISVGETGSVSFTTTSDEIVVVPIILGDTGGDAKAYTCDDSYGKTITA